MPQELVRVALRRGALELYAEGFALLLACLLISYEDQVSSVLLVVKPSKIIFLFLRILYPKRRI